MELRQEKGKEKREDNEKTLKEVERIRDGNKRGMMNNITNGKIRR